MSDALRDAVRELVADWEDEVLYAHDAMDKIKALLANPPQDATEHHCPYPAGGCTSSRCHISKGRAEERAYERGHVAGYENGLLDPGSAWMNDRERKALAAVEEVLNAPTSTDQEVSCGGFSIDSSGCFAGDLAGRIRAAIEGALNQPGRQP